jgi:hypothetical protein
MERMRRNRPFAGRATEPRGPTHKMHLWLLEDRGVADEAVMLTRLVDVPTAGSRQFIEQLVGFFQICGVEAFSEPAVDGLEKLICFGPPTLLRPQPRKAHGGAQFQKFGPLLRCDTHRSAKVSIGLPIGT